jgi:hydroxymethylbilane synthase
VKPLRIATRGSALALWQANHLRDALQNLCGVPAEILTIKTSGDRFTSAPLEQIGVKGVFTKELEDALLDGRADLAVHSMKDVPTDFSPDCRVVAVFEREDPRDALVSASGATLAQLPAGTRVGSSSLRRAAQIRLARPDLEIADIRGNVDTRLRKLDSGAYGAIVLAKAGLVRLGLAARITELLPPEVVLPAVGQGALAVEFLAARDGDFAFLDRIIDRPTLLAVTAERAVLAELQGGCRLPLGAWARFDGATLKIDACVLSVDGAESIRRSRAALCACEREAAALGKKIAGGLLEAGADRLLRLAGKVA